MSEIMLPVVLSDTAETVLKRRYYLKDNGVDITEDWESLCRRVARAIATIERDDDLRSEYEDRFFEMIYYLDFLPNSPCLMNAGTGIGQLSACFVLPIEDSMDGIFSAIRNGALVHKTGGGTGYSFSRLRPKNSAVHSTQGVASGPLSFCSVFDAATETIKQGGKRRGANMGVLRVDHPDIMEFITAKQDQTRYTNFNFSVAITDTFMKAVHDDQDYDLIDPVTGVVVESLSAGDVFNKIVELAWHNGEPGVLFIDAANRANTTPQLGDFEATNPCWTGETKVLTSEGPIRFDKLAEMGNDILVLTQDDEGHLHYQMMRNPRKTADNASLVCISFDNGAHKICTPNHNIYLHSGEKVQAIDLVPGDSVASLHRYGVNNKGYKCLVVSVTPITRKDAVYNGTVDGTHRYFVMCGDDDAILSANCGEQWLLPYESCNLGSINLSQYVKDGEVDWDRLSSTTHLAVRFLDNVIDCNRFPIPEIEEMTMKTRKIGLGIMGMHDMLIQLQLPYGSEEGRKVASEVMTFIRDNAKSASIMLGTEKGSFPAYDPIHNTYTARRNAALTSIQPTGTVSMIADCASGCEPYFSIVMIKHVMDGDKLLMVNKHFERIAREEGFYSDDLLKRVADSGTVVGHDDIPKRWQEIFRTAQDIAPRQHIRMQAILQTNGVDSSISKTINLPKEATLEDVRSSYLLGYELHCKGLTVYRDGSRDNQVLNSTIITQDDSVVTGQAVKAILPDVLNARRYRLKDIDGNTIYLIVCFDEDEKPMEVFAKFPFDNRMDLKDKSTMWTTTCRFVSLALRCQIPMNEIIRQLDRSSGHMLDLPAQLSKLLKSFMATTHHGFTSMCPECKGVLIYEEGCETCHICGYSKCS